VQKGEVVILCSAVFIYLLALAIQRWRLYFLFAGWKPYRISDHDAYGALLCQGLKQFSAVFALFCIPSLFDVSPSAIYTICAVIFPLIPLFLKVREAKKKYYT